MRPLPWLSPLLCGVVLAVGGYAGLSGLGEARWVPFVGGLVALVALDAVGSRWAGSWERGSAGVGPRWRLVGLTAVQAGLVVVVAFADGSGMARVLFLLVPFGVYFAFGRVVAVGVGVAVMAFLVVAFQVTVPGWTRSVGHVSDLVMFGIGVVLAVVMAEMAAAGERNRVARDVHDGIGHHLTAVSVLLEKAVAFRQQDAEVADRAIEDARQSARQALEDVRTSVRALREPFRLGDALVRLTGPLGADVTCTGDESRYATNVLLALYRAAQEGITNAVRHGGPDVTVTVHCGPREARLAVIDNGSGFAPEREGFGLRGLRERIAQVGGTVDVTCGAGTRLTVVVPRRAAA
ncbi:signal transduction histidine kinase [Saccharothrix saharensis]|uniref:histidine kinase n=1 Tax=Saccharothrix saharensis TaxID=571190 RepID=A0A543J932_9PSEU|nr:sensor histidine kinase [Saccharothrix saharensis]TQM79326.1 signal transduction histidine kinase [Saccharothrix saharensis]